MLTQEEIFRRVLRAISEVPKAEVNGATMESTFEDLGLDSLGRVEAALSLEAEFGIRIPDEVAEKVETVGGAVQEVAKLLGAEVASNK